MHALIVFAGTIKITLFADIHLIVDPAYVAWPHVSHAPSPGGMSTILLALLVSIFRTRTARTSSARFILHGVHALHSVEHRCTGRLIKTAQMA